jgi:hypothetical protein
VTANARPDLSLVVAHPELVPWWIADDLTATEARRILKAITSVMVVLAQRLELPGDSLSPLINAVMETQDTGNDRADLQAGMELVLDELGP